MLMPLFLAFVLLLVIGCPIAICLGASSALALIVGGGFDLTIAMQRMFNAVNSFPLMAIPFFMLAGTLMEQGGISKRIIRFADAFLGHVTGGLGIVAVVSCMIFAAISGSAVATVAAIGSLIVPEMIERGYSRELATATVTAAGTTGPIIPPSTLFVLYASIAGVSVTDMFKGGYIPGLMMGGVLVYIIPYYRLTEDVCSFLTAHFDRIMAYRFCEEEFRKFRQIAVLGMRKPRAENPRMARLLELASLSPDKLPTLDQIPPGRYPLPDAEKAVSLFQGARFNVRELQEQMRRMGSMLPKRSALDGQEKRPPLPLTIGQIGLVGGSGLINGLIECETPHVLKGRVIKAKQRRTGDNYENEDGSTTTEIIETTSNKMVFNLLTPSGVKLLA